MKAQLQLFGAAHLSMLAAVPAIAAVLAFMHRKLPASAKTIRLGLAVALVFNTILFYGWRIETGALSFPNGLPFELCDLSLFLTILSVFTLKPLLFDLAYYWALAGASMALLTPNLTDPFPSFGTVEFFITHGLTVSAVLYLVWSHQARPRRWSVAKAMLGINVVALFDGPFDYFFGTDYFFLRAKPVNPSLLDFLGPWPWYILSTEGVALILFLLLYLPVRQAGAETPVETEAVWVKE
ncbi:MAG TPA: TIGR02206 family membrane protein [Terracidiphilus sp.]|nr:TIGR02206 family membrane protein [Terracidiphilus sp.]